MLKRGNDIVRNAVRQAHRAVRLARRDRQGAILLARMSLWVVTVSLGARLISLPRLLQFVTPRPQINVPARPLPGQPERLARLIDSLLRINIFVFTPTCWKRAIVLYRYLALKGFQTRIVFGVRRENEGFLNGHAWLESDDRPVLESKPTDYAKTFSFPS